MWTAEEIDRAVIELPQGCTEDYQIAKFLKLPERNAEHAPHAVCAWASFQIPGFPFAVLLYFHEESLKKKGWPFLFDTETKVCRVLPRSPRPELPKL